MKQRDLIHCTKFLPQSIDTFTEGNMDRIDNQGYTIEYDGFHFSAYTHKGVINSVIRYIFKTVREKLKEEIKREGD